VPLVLGLCACALECNVGSLAELVALAGRDERWQDEVALLVEKPDTIGL
jgi:hypothetical protein